ncbi:MAG TPA: hypothetical protein VHL58_16335 [Thermoanaerobaculia bacterium]|nr:hypothetical protein [Thermoanaerobaculia bacterium]
MRTQAGVKDPASLGDDRTQQVNKAVPIGVVETDMATLVAAAGDMVDGARKGKAERPGHGGARRSTRNPTRTVWDLKTSTNP